MAEELDRWPDAEPQASRYPWDQWLNGSVWRLDAGTDYDASMKPDSIRGTISKAARVRGGSCRTRAVNGGKSVILQYLAPKERKPVPDPSVNARIRTWAKSRGMDVPERGRLPAHVSDAYRRAHIGSHPLDGDEGAIQGGVI